MIMKIKSLFAIIFTVAFLSACGSSDSTNQNRDTSPSEPTGGPSAVAVELDAKTPLNISVYLDLSDRLTRDMQPSQAERDSAIVDYLTEVVKQHAIAQKIVSSKDRIKVFFYPAPNNSRVALLSDDLEMDLGATEFAQKKKVLKEFQEKFRESLSQIYSTSLSQKNWVGSDIWGFFKKPIDNYCIKNGYRNILVVLTDGYIFFDGNKQKEGDAYSYILPQTLNNKNSKLIVSRERLENLEVLFLEVNPYDLRTQDQMEKIIKDWLKDMGVKKYYVGNTDQPSNTKMIIESFLK